METLVAKL